ncbi:response regulator transcription factor [Leptolyngbya ohadii]|uniref:response regulator transcription factor n=1 Tax=Leptolyngbya ohadii TaxID=1962290 RepID=UPI0021F1AAE0|nr:response regulator transcription factor [Leptolyngbya ohadii]
MQQTRSAHPSSNSGSDGSKVQIRGLSTENEHPSCKLTDRELEVLQLIVQGCSNEQISQQLYITVGTVKTHVRNVLSKMSVDDRTQAAVRALRSGLVS